MASSDSSEKRTLDDDLKDINADLEQVKEPVPEALDLQDRDPSEMNEFVKVSWEEIFAEPQNVHSYPTIWINSYKCYVGSKFWCYRLCTLICGIPFAFCWGLAFAMLTFWHIWHVGGLRGSNSPPTYKEAYHAYRQGKIKF